MVCRFLKVSRVFFSVVIWLFGCSKKQILGASKGIGMMHPKEVLFFLGRVSAQQLYGSIHHTSVSNRFRRFLNSKFQSTKIFGPDVADILKQLIMVMQKRGWNYFQPFDISTPVGW